MKRVIALLLCIIIMFFLILGYVNTNKLVEDYHNTCYNLNDEVTYNSTNIIVKNAVVLSLQELHKTYNISETIIEKEKEDYGDAFVYIIYSLDVSNVNSDLCYFDFTHFTIEIDDWFSWMSMDLFKELNPQLKNELRVCMYPGISTEILIPFMLYHDNNEDNFIYRHLTDGKIILNLGIYPEKYYLETRIKDFKTEGL